MNFRAWTIVSLVSLGILWVTFIVSAQFQYSPTVNLTATVEVVDTNRCLKFCFPSKGCRTLGKLVVQDNGTNATLDAPYCCTDLHCCKNMTLWSADNETLSCTQSYKPLRVSVFNVAFISGVLATLGTTLFCLFFFGTLCRKHKTLS